MQKFSCPISRFVRNERCQNIVTPGIDKHLYKPLNASLPQTELYMLEVGQFGLFWCNEVDTQN